MTTAAEIVKDLLEETDVEGALDALCDGAYLAKSGIDDQATVEEAFSILKEMQTN